jgi:hypothetical protein
LKQVYNVPKNLFFIIICCRYERKKNISLAIDAFRLLKQSRCGEGELPVSSASGTRGKKVNKIEKGEGVQLQLVVAGGYDVRVTENVEYLQVVKSFILCVLPYYLIALNDVFGV